MRKAGREQSPKPLSRDLLCSYELRGNRIVARLFGIFPVQNVHLSEIHYLRLSSKDETTPIYLFFNWPHFLPYRRSVRPVYVLQTKTHRRLFLKLDGNAHFKLRQAMARTREPRQQRRRMAA